MAQTNNTFGNRAWHSRFCGRIRSCKISSLTFPHATARFICRGEKERPALSTRAIIASVAAKVLTTDGHEEKIYTLTGPATLGIAEVARILSEVTGHEFKYVDVPEAAARDGMLQAGVPSWQVDLVMELHAVNKQNRWSTVTSDIEKVTGTHPTDFAQFARDHADKFRAS